MIPPRYLLDTNICIYIRRQQPHEVLARFQKIRPGAAVISVITYGELLFGAEKSANRARALQLLEELISVLPVLALPREAASAYGAIRASLQARGETIGNNDLWIAAHAKAAGITMVTNNEKEFRRIAGLKVQNWAKRS
jgi:tRNA(fMet)-specific endonuclease VapC